MTSSRLSSQEYQFWVNYPELSIATRHEKQNVDEKIVLWKILVLNWKLFLKGQETRKISSDVMLRFLIRFATFKKQIQLLTENLFWPEENVQSFLCYRLERKLNSIFFVI